jgi:hypothetical protein
LKNKFGDISSDERTQSQAGSSTRHQRTCPLEPQVPNPVRLMGGTYPRQVNGKMTTGQLRIMNQSPLWRSLHNQDSLQTFKVAAKDMFLDSLAFWWKVKMAADGDVGGAAPVIVNNIYRV